MRSNKRFLIVGLACLPVLAVAALADFSPPVFHNAGPIPVALATGDLDDDGDEDVAVINRQGHLRVLFNDGAGCLTSVARHDGLWPVIHAGDWPTIPSLIDLALGDLNGDGRQDFVATLPESNGTASLVLNRGGGMTEAPANFSACAHVKNVAIADFDGEGSNDLAVTSNCFKATVLLNDRQGGFTIAGSFGQGYTSGEIAASDLDGDGDQDLAFLNIGISNVALLANNGDGTFAENGGYAVGDNPHDLVLADLDGDGDFDLATANFYSNDVSVLLNDGGGSFTPARSTGSGLQPEGLAAGDLDGDNLPELVVANDGGDDLTILGNMGGGAFSVRQSLSAGIRPNDVALADLNGDGRLDVIELNLRSETVGVMLNEAQACPAPAPEPPNDILLPLFTKPAVSGRQRLVFVYWGTDARSESVVIFRNGVKLLTTVNDSYHWDDVTKKRGSTFRYRVCETGDFGTCSAESTVTF